MNKFERYLGDSIRGIIIAIAALTPLIMSFWHYDAYDLPKITFVYISVLVLVLLVTIDDLLVKKRLSWARTPLDLPIAAFLGISVLAVLFSGTPLASIVGEYSRYQTIQSLFAYAFIYQIAARYLQGQEWLNRLFIAIFAAFSVSIIYGLAQSAGYDILPAFMQRLETRPRSTMGNAVFFGTYITIVLPMLVSSLLDKRKVLIKNSWIHVWLVGLVVAAFAVGVLTESRGAWIGLAVGLLAVGLLNKESTGKYAPKIVIAGVTVAVLVVFLFSISGGQSVSTKINHLSARVSDAFSLQGSAGARVEILKSSVRMFAAKPLLGYGLDQTQFNFLKYRTLQNAQYERFAIPDRAHSEYFQIFLDSGVLGGIAFLWLLLIALLSWRNRDHAHDYYMKAIFAGFIAYLAQAFTGISMTGTIAVLAVLAGTMAAYYNSDKDIRTLSLKRVWPGYVATVVVAMAVIFVAVITLIPFMTDVHLHRAMKYAQDPQVGKAVLIDEVRQATRLWPYQNYYSVILARWLIDYAIETESSALLSEAIAVAEQGLLYYPEDSSLYLLAGRSYVTLGQVQDDTASQRKGEAYLMIKQQLDPLDPQSRESLLRIYMGSDRYKEALKEAKFLVKLFPENVKFIEKLAIIYESLGSISEANGAYRQIKKISPEFPDIDINIERTAGSVKLPAP